MAKHDKDQKEGNWFKRHKILTGVLGIIVLVILINAVGGGSDSAKQSASNDNTTTANADTKDAPKAEAAAKIGAPARDGKFEFVVNSVKCGETTVGSNEYLQEKASGQFCRLNLTIKNIGNEAQSLFGDNQKLLDAQSREFSYDSSATIYAAPTGATGMWFDEINPGNTVTGDLIFDVPAGTTPTRAKLHDSAFSSGVNVSLQ